MTPLAATVAPEWLALREPADHDARARDLVSRVSAHLPARNLVVHDLGSGTGSMARWLSPQLPGPQRWVLHDRDDGLLSYAAFGPALLAADGSKIHLETRRGDVTTLASRELSGCSLITASALLDLLTAEEIRRIVTACVAVGCPALLTLTVTGRVVLSPPHPLDGTLRAAFNDHQRRAVSGRRLLGPDAVEHTSAVFTQLGARVTQRRSPWRLSAADNAALLTEWLTGWVAAACAQRPDLAHPARTFLRQRLADVAADRLSVVIEHADLLAVPERPVPNRLALAHVYRHEGSET